VCNAVATSRTAACVGGALADNLRAAAETCRLDNFCKKTMDKFNTNIVVNVRVIFRL
jgi:hypothetical protein